MMLVGGVMDASQREKFRRAVEVQNRERRNAPLRAAPLCVQTDRAIRAKGKYSDAMGVHYYSNSELREKARRKGWRMLKD